MILIQNFIVKKHELAVENIRNEFVYTYPIKIMECWKQKKNMDTSLFDWMQPYVHFILYLN